MLDYELSSVDLPLDWDELFSADAPVGDTARTIPDALILSLTNKGRVDIRYIEELTGESYEAVTKALKGSIFQNPDRWGEDDYCGWETAEEYLSGNLRKKLKSAKDASKLYTNRFNSNIQAIKKVLPPSVTSENIYVTLGSPWVPVEIIDEFINHLFKIKGKKGEYTLHNEVTGTWEIKNKRYFDRYMIASVSTYGTRQMPAMDILENTLNMKSVSVMREVYSPDTKTGKRRVLCQSETVLVLEKQQILINEFKSWVWTDDKRRRKLETIFENKYSCVRRRIFDGSFLHFPGMADGVGLFPYQKDAVARILFSANTLLAHDVGSGKSYVMIAAGMELRRMGLSKKNLYVVPNNLVIQWRSFFEKIYPDARVFCVEAKNFTPAKRETTLATVRDEEFDAVIMAYSCFDRIPLSSDWRIRDLEEAKLELSKIAELGTKISAELRRKKEALAAQIAELMATVDEDDESICFDELGVTRLFVDEAHNYKNVPIETKTDKVLGISAGGSKKCRDMMDKVHFVQKENDGGGVIMATGTPITNSLTDAFVMQKYLQSGELAMLDLQNFDSWIGMFAERVTEFEVDVDTNSYRLATRFSRFHNLPELTALLASIADFHRVDECVDLPTFKGYTDTLVPRTTSFAEYLKNISRRAEAVRHGSVDRRTDNMLKITTDGRKAALDLRLVDSLAAFDHQSKVRACAENVYNVYIATSADRCSQLIFCDTSTPKAEFNIYDEMKRLLLQMGIPESELAFVHDASTESQRAKLFAKVRSGEVRVLIGSTFKLGMGVNVQERLVAVHHLDLPWRPADMTQRQGRILRQGNRNKRVFIYRYVTEGSFDAYSWQLLETKERFITELLAGSLTDRSGPDVDSTVLNYAEIKALAIGNPLVKERVETANELERCLALYRKAIENRVRLEQEQIELPGKIEHQAEQVKLCRLDLKWYQTSVADTDGEKRRAIRDELTEAIRAHTADPSESRTVMEYRGFSVILPAYMSADRPYIWLERSGKYYVELGESGFGALVRIDNFLEKLDEHYKKMNDELKNMRENLNAIGEELARGDDHADRIEHLKSKLQRIDKELGVNWE